MGIKTRMYREGGSWVEELPNVLWAHKTMPRTRNEETPFSLTYGIEAVILTEIGMPTHRTTQRDKEENKVELRLNLNLLEERQEVAAIREARCNDRWKKSIGKLGPKWERPYKVIEAYGTGAVSLKM
ncbi:reverse transcriptase domain-containing protein [Tanacetum coccineum]|uniref:Reverse transcriptase domain-containing protein n=1 Tax=Tanacetum coccineum TaxID=301880 RepID=A0ABQ4WKQ1_9ASTR